ncbi:sensor histidine kinase [Paracidovorax valerianellae]|uniref:histidine kinase n=1 Tax=Paracidovorax valerianellae TaxID=187868 RepID=A0A1G7BBX0_9BURK|nr:ATP-binding protein [Paracidovorax valerianellae]MDA8445865.1 ATP-binding protein [Paracidovorax valerianellae]SDE24462.1 His Kinase A (phospho-acceptor) domain-containing protein [Paracidovorax valerianellae]
MDGPHSDPQSGLGALPTDEVARLKAELEAARQEQETFLRAVSHDLRAPVRHILAYGRLARETVAESNADPEALQFLDTIAQAGQQLGSMIDGLIQLGRIGSAPVLPGPLDLGPALHKAMAAALAAAAAAPQKTAAATADWPGSVQWDLPSADACPMVWADAGWLHDVLLALLDNALKFSRGAQPPRIVVQAQKQGEQHIAITVQDNGAGFAAAQAGQLFQVFQRLHPVSQFDGLGLGLARCRRLVTRMGGTIDISAVPQQGCTVRVVLPAVCD